MPFFEVGMRRFTVLGLWSIMNALRFLLLSGAWRADVLRLGQVAPTAARQFLEL